MVSIYGICLFEERGRGAQMESRVGKVEQSGRQGDCTLRNVIFFFFSLFSFAKSKKLERILRTYIGSVAALLFIIHLNFALCNTRWQNL